MGDPSTAIAALHRDLGSSTKSSHLRMQALWFEFNQTISISMIFGHFKISMGKLRRLKKVISIHLEKTKIVSLRTVRTIGPTKSNHRDNGRHAFLRKIFDPSLLLPH